MRRLATLALVASAVAANASFDLMLLPGNDGRIHRYDPQNRVGLGAYGANESGMITADNRGISYAATMFSGDLQAMNYSTGQQVAMYSGVTDYRAIELAGNYVYGIAGTSLRRTNIVTGSSNTVGLDAAVTWQSLTTFGSHVIAIGRTTSNALSFQSVSTNTFIANPALASTNTLTSGTNIGKAAVVVNPITNQATMVFSMAAPASTLFYSRKTLQSDGNFSTGVFISGTLANFATAEMLPNVVAGHAGGVWFYGQDGTSAGLARITRGDMGSTSLSLGESHTFTAPGGGFTNLNFSSHAGIVIAPEPGTIAAMGLGLAAVLRRRRSKSNPRT